MTVTTLTDGGQEPVEIARGAARLPRRGADVARPRPLRLQARAGDSRSSSSTRSRRRRERGVAVRIAYNADYRAPIPVPPPPETTPEDIERLIVPTKPIAGIPDLMHHKYVVRDRASVWTGSANWTDDSWSREENVIAVVDSPELATPSRSTSSSSGRGERRGGRAGRAAAGPGRRDRGPAVVLPRLRRRALAPDREGDRPGEAPRADLLAGDHAPRRCSATLAQVIADGKVDVAGAVDSRRSRRSAPVGADRRASWKLPLLRDVIGSGRFAGKRVDAVGPGHGARLHAREDHRCRRRRLPRLVQPLPLRRENSENVLEIHDPALAERLAGYVDGVRARYPVASLAPS